MPGKGHEVRTGTLPKRGKIILEEVYEKERAIGRTKQSSAKIAWHATREAGFKKKSYAKK